MANDAIKMLDPCALATLTCRTMLCEQGFGAVGEAAEWLLGHPVWTHEFIAPQIKSALIEAVRAQYPTLVLDPPADWRALVADIRAQHGLAVPVKRGDRKRVASPVKTLEKLLSEKARTNGE